MFFVNQLCQYHNMIYNKVLHTSIILKPSHYKNYRLIGKKNMVTNKTNLF